MWTGGHNEAIPFALKSAWFFITILPSIYVGVKVQGKINHNIRTIYPDKRLDINGNYLH